MDILVITVSDRAFNGVYEDLSGPAIKSVIHESFPEANVNIEIVPDEKEHILGALENGLVGDFIFTTGGTGIGPRDITPDITETFCDKMIPGIAETLRRESYKETPQAMLSRAVAGIRGKTVVVNFPGSLKGASFCMETVLPLLHHAIKMRDGAGH